MPPAQPWPKTYDGQAWCPNAESPPARFEVCGRWPPLPFDSLDFDLIYAISVFTHLEAAELDRWLNELGSRLSSSGALLFTLHGRQVWSRLPEDQKSTVQTQGQLTLSSQKLKGIFPDWYQTSFHTESYARETCLRHFRHVEYFPDGMGYQDAVVCQDWRPGG